MRKILLLFLLTCALTAVVKGQEYKKFKFGVGIGPVWADRYGSAGGILITLEPAFRTSDNLAMGLRLEQAVVGGGLIDNLEVVSSVTVNGQYYLSDNKLRVFTGLGLGFYEYGSDAFGTKFGLYPRVGFDIRHFSVSLDFNFIAESRVFNNSIVSKYFGLRIGGFFGGGKN